MIWKSNNNFYLDGISAFFDVFSEKDRHLNAAETLNTVKSSSENIKKKIKSCLSRTINKKALPHYIHLRRCLWVLEMKSSPSFLKFLRLKLFTYGRRRKRNTRYSIRYACFFCLKHCQNAFKLETLYKHYGVLSLVFNKTTWLKFNIRILVCRSAHKLNLSS